MPSLPSIPAVTTPPTLASAMAAAKDGSIYKDPSHLFAESDALAGLLPPDISATFTSMKLSLVEQMKADQAKLPNTFSIVSANCDLINKQKMEETGKPATSEELEAACGPLAIFEQAPTMLKAKMQEIVNTIKGYSDSFGITSMASHALDVAKSVAQQAATFALSIPAQFNALGQQTQEYLTFIGNSANSAMMSALNSMRAATASVTNSLTSAFGAMKAAADSARTEAIAALKSFADTMKLSGSFSSPCATKVKNDVVDSSKLPPVKA